MLFNENKCKISDGPPYYVNVDVKSGESLAIQLFDGNKKFVNGPATITMLSHTTYPPMPLPLNLPPGHSMQQIVDENGVLKHIIIGSPSNASDSMAKNQILSKNGSKLTPIHLNGAASRLNSFKKKLPSINYNNNETIIYSKPTRYSGLIDDTITNDTLISNSTSLLNSSNLVYPFCCCCCPDCVPNQINSNSINQFSNTNQLNFSRPINYYLINQTNATSITKPVVNNYLRRNFANDSLTTVKSNRNDKLENGRIENHRFENGKVRNQIINRKENNGINNKNNLVGKNNKTNLNKFIFNSSCSSNCMSASLTNQSKSALLGNKQACKQCSFQDQQTNNYTHLTSNLNFNHKYFYPGAFQKSSYQTANQSNYYQTSNKNVQPQKYSYALDASKQSSNKNQQISKSNYHLIIQQPTQTLLNKTTTNISSKDCKINSYVPLNKKESDSYSELIKYVNSNHISAFKSNKRISLNTSKSNQQNNQSNEINKDRTSNSVTASSSPISEHYDFSSEESEQITCKHTTLLDYPTNYSPNYGYNYCLNYSNESSTNSSLNYSTTINKKSLKLNKKSTKNDIQLDDKNIDEKAKSKNNLKNVNGESKIIITNDDKDDGYEDDFELKNCDNKSNDDVIDEIVDKEITNKLSEDKLNKTLPEKIENDTSKIKNQLDKFKKQFTSTKTSPTNLTNENIMIKCELYGNKISEDKKILDENLNEIHHVDGDSWASKEIEPMKFNCAKNKLQDRGEHVQSINTEADDKPNHKDDNKLDSIEIITKQESFKQDTNKQKLANQQLMVKERIEDNSINEKSINDESVEKIIRKKPEPIKIVSFALSYTKLTSNYVKLKWIVLNNGNNMYAIAKENQFMVEMIYSKSNNNLSDESDATNKSSRIVFTGLVKHCKIQCLKPLEEYSFRVKLIYNDYRLISNLLTITTPEIQIQSLNVKKRTSKHNLQFSIQQQQILKQQQIMIEKKEKELQLKQPRPNQQQTLSQKPSTALFVLFCAICSLFKENFAYLLIIFFSISAFFFANFLSKDLI